MSAFVGEAVNLTMVDGFELGVVLADAVHGWMRVEDPELQAAHVGWEDPETRMEGRSVGAMAA